ncbi:hypothetical protein QUA82_18110 [Microcoleus sp. F8-D3]
MSSLFDFLTDIAINPKQQLAFARQPNAVTAAFGLAEADMAVAESKSFTKITAVFANELTPLAALCMDPSPEDPLPDPDPEPAPNEPESRQDYLEQSN